MNLPNTLTTIRLLLVGVFAYVFLALDNYILAVVVFGVAAVTDLLDGYLARKLNQITNYGKLMDPLADKLMLIVALGCLVYEGQLPFYILLFVVVKEALMIIGGLVIYKSKSFAVYSLQVGKLAAAIFNIGVIITFARVLVDRYTDIAFWRFDLILYGIAIILAIIAFCQYARDFWRRRNELGGGTKSKQDESHETGSEDEAAP